MSARQGALFEAPDAFYRTQGVDAIHAAPVATQKLDQRHAGRRLMPAFNWPDWKPLPPEPERPHFAGG